mmetsp:Transcript_59736/g.139785  ORF Transcript_59736/g.139785 Transcript_59736/m.139785 type:complete len:331 (-) Transcript_59736:237-1229(-)
MGAVQAENVRAGFDHLRDHLLAPRGRAKGGHNLGLPLAVVRLLPLQAHAAVDHLRRPQGHLAVDGHEWAGLVQSGLDRLGLARGGSLRHNGFARVLAGGGLAREHDRIGSIPNCVHEVRHLCAGGHRVLDHALHHLRRSDHKKAGLLGPLDQQLLRKGYAAKAELDSQITTCNHQGLAFGDDALDVGESLGLFDLGANLGALLRRHIQTIHDVDEFLEILSFLSEGHANVLDGRLQLQKELGVLDIFGGQGRTVDLNVGHVHSLPCLQLAPAGDLDFQLTFRAFLHHLHLHDAIFQEQRSAWLACFDQGRLFKRWLHRDTPRADVVIVIL